MIGKNMRQEMCVKIILNEELKNVLTEKKPIRRTKLLLILLFYTPKSIIKLYCTYYLTFLSITIFNPTTVCLKHEDGESLSFEDCSLSLSTHKKKQFSPYLPT